MNTKEVDFKVILNNKIVQVIINVLFGISTASLTMILIEQEFAENYIYVLLPLLSFMIGEIITFKCKLLKKTFKNFNVWIFIISTILGLFATYYNWIHMSYTVLTEEIKIFFLLAIPAVIVFLYWFYDKLVFYSKKYILSLDKIEKYYLIIGTVILVIGIICIYTVTNVFHNASVHDKNYKYIVENENNLLDEKTIKMCTDKLYDILKYNTLYTSDTILILSEDAYMTISTEQNDLKQPLFGVFSIPFHSAPRMISLMFPDVPNLYPILIAIIQGILVFIAFTLLARLMKVEGIIKILFLIILSISYPTLLFLLNLEQYLMSFFYMIVFIYFAFNHIKEKDIAYIAATGSMLTSGIFFPLLGERKNIKQSIKNILFTFLKCIAILIVSARIILIFPKASQEEIERIKRIFYINRIYNV